MSPVCINRRGFMQIGARLLDVATRDVRSAHLIYFDVSHLQQTNDTMGRSAGRCHDPADGQLHA